MFFIKNGIAHQVLYENILTSRIKHILSNNNLMGSQIYLILFSNYPYFFFAFYLEIEIFDPLYKSFLVLALHRILPILYLTLLPQTQSIGINYSDQLILTLVVLMIYVILLYVLSYLDTPTPHLITYSDHHVDLDQNQKRKVHNGNI